MSFQFDTLPSSSSAVIRQHSRSFSWAAKMLPREIRDDVEKLYAWCRWCDNAVDEAGDLDSARERLTMLQQDVMQIYAGRVPQHPASIWLADLVQSYDIPRELPLDLLRGMQTDARNPVLETVEELKLYSYRVAGTVGLMMCRILGVKDRYALSKANSMGIALQLTNIARDVEQDWRSRRRYIPGVWLCIAPGKDDSPSNSDVRLAVEQLLDFADRYYEQGDQGLACLPDRVRFAIRLAASVYREIGIEIRRRDFAVMNGRTVVPRGRKVLLFVRCVASEFSFRLRRFIGRCGARVQRNRNNKTICLEQNIFMNNDALYLFYLGLSMTLIMATTLFVLVGVNPKDSSYEALPWVYALISAILATVTGWVARRYNGVASWASVKEKIKSR